MKKLLISILICFAVAVGIIYISGNTTTKEITITKEQYYDKTLGGVIGHVAGLLSGFEFVTRESMPYVGMPDEWFGFGKGSYSDADHRGGAGVNRIFGNGKIASDDDYHIDFFNQLILDKHGPDPSFKDIKDEWLNHQVSDWGGGFKAMETMNNYNLMPPFTGKYEYGNIYNWCTEPYIENDTIGMVFPGMPQKAADMGEKLGSVTGDFDSVTWAKFLAAMYSIAYFESDSREVLEKAAVVLPENSWPYQVYLKCNELHKQYPKDWRASAEKIAAAMRPIYGSDNMQVAPDVNNGFLILSILYGNNDYAETCKIASLIGFDGDCTAASATGIMGIIKGFSGTPKEVKDLVYADGNGTYINDKTFDPHIKNHYPDEQKFTDIVRLYVRNTEKAITANGGKVKDKAYHIKGQEIMTPKVVVIDNYDFEKGDLSGWSKWTPNADTEKIVPNNDGFAHTGAWAGTVNTDESVKEGKLFVKLKGLKKGKTYRVKAFVMTADGKEARLYAENYGGPYIYTSAYTTVGWVSREIEFKAQNTTAEVGLHVPEGEGGHLWASIDDLQVEEIKSRYVIRYEAEIASVAGGSTKESKFSSGRKYVGELSGNTAIQFENVKVKASGEYIIRINYANGREENAFLKLTINNDPVCGIMFPKSGSKGKFSTNVLDVPVEFKEGDNTVKFEGNSLQPELDYIEILPLP